MDAVTTWDVVVVGGGFAGVAVADRLGKAGVSVLLVDRVDYHQFKPLNYQVATAELGAAEVGRPLREIFRRRRSVQVAVDKATAVDAATRTVTLASGARCAGRVLVVATGAEANFFGTPGAEHAFPMYTLADAVRLRDRMRTVLDRADRPGRPPAELSVVVVGGGPTGVETAGAIADNLNSVIARTYRAGVAEAATVHLVDHGTELLKPFSETSHRYARTALESAGVRLHMGVAVAEIAADRVRLSDDSVLPADVTVWAGGLQGGDLLTDSGLEIGRGGRVAVADTLEVPGHPGVYVLGDLAAIPDGTGGVLPQLGSVAQQSGDWAAKNILADLRGGARTPFVYRDKGVMAMIGRGAAVAEIGASRRQLTGRLAFLAWLGVHLALLSGTREKISAAATWLVDYGVRLRTRRSR